MTNLIQFQIVKCTRGNIFLYKSSCIQLMFNYIIRSSIWHNSTNEVLRYEIINIIFAINISDTKVFEVSILFKEISDAFLFVYILYDDMYHDRILSVISMIERSSYTITSNLISPCHMFIIVALFYPIIFDSRMTSWYERTIKFTRSAKWVIILKQGQIKFQIRTWQGSIFENSHWDHDIFVIIWFKSRSKMIQK